MTNTNKKTDGFLRFNKHLCTNLVNRAKSYAKEGFTTSYIAEYTTFEFNNLYEKSAEEIYTIVKELNHYAINNLKCHVQGIVVCESEQKVIICFSRKIYLCDICDASEYIKKFQRILENGYSQTYTTNQILKYFEVLEFVKSGHSIADFGKKRELEGEELDFTIELTGMYFKIMNNKNVQDCVERVIEIQSCNISDFINDLCEFILTNYKNRNLQ